MTSGLNVRLGSKPAVAPRPRQVRSPEIGAQPLPAAHPCTGGGLLKYLV